MSKNKKIEVTKAGSKMRPLTLDDAKEEYLGWFDSSALEHKIASSTTKDLRDLKQYVLTKQNKEDVLFLGIVDNFTGKHIGNIKYELVNTNLRYAIANTFIGVEKVRGIGLVAEVITETSKCLRKCFNISKIFLGVDLNNSSDIMMKDALIDLGLKVKKINYPYLKGSYANVVRDYFYFLISYLGIKKKTPFWRSAMEIYSRK